MKRIAFASLCLLCALALGSCTLFDSLFYNAEEVRASELDDYSGSTATTKDEAKAAVIAGADSGAIPIGAFITAGPSGNVIAMAFPRLLPSYNAGLAAQAAAESGAAVSRAAPAPVVAADGSVSIAWNGSGEVVSTNPEVKLSGSISGSVSKNVATVTPTNQLTFPLDVSASLKADIQATVGPLASAGLKGARMNAKAKGDATLKGSMTEGYTAKGYAAASMYAGMSLSETSSHKGGKFIVSVKYVENINTTVRMSEVMAGSASGGLELEVVVTVYDNNDKKVGAFTFGAQDFASVLVN